MEKCVCEFTVIPALLRAPFALVFLLSVSAVCGRWQKRQTAKMGGRRDDMWQRLYARLAGTQYAPESSEPLWHHQTPRFIALAAAPRGKFKISLQDIIDAGIVKMTALLLMQVPLASNYSSNNSLAAVPCIYITELTYYWLGYWTVTNLHYFIFHMHILSTVYKLQRNPLVFPGLALQIFNIFI